LPITNKQLAQQFGITTQWIEERTGIQERRYFKEGATSDMVVQAIKHMGLSATELQQVDGIIVATITPDYHCPSTAAIVLHKLGLPTIYGIDIAAACSGFVYAIEMADALISSGKYQQLLIIGADKMSSIIDHNDRKTALIFADGASCCLVANSSHSQVVATVCAVDSSLCHSVLVPNGGSANPITTQNFAEQQHYLRFTDKKVFDTGIQLLQQAIEKVLEKAGATLHDIDIIVPHQANKRMLEALAQRMHIPIEKFFINIEYIGNTSAATIPIALSQAQEQGLLKGNVLLASVGAGFTYGAGLLKL
jgi:3-oxoacyl-[acyl-carrier-protein] synthase III